MRRTVILTPPVRRWHCPNCAHTMATRQHGEHVPMHTCAGLRGLSAPMVEEGQRAAVYAVERDDYLAGAVQTTDEAGRPITAVVRERADGNDVWAHAEHARVVVTS